MYKILVVQIYARSPELWLNQCWFRWLSPSLKHDSNFNQKELWMLNIDLDTDLLIFYSEFLNNSVGLQIM